MVEGKLSLFCIIPIVSQGVQLFLFHYVGAPNPDNVPEDGKLKSTHIVGGTRRYYLDLKENQRGRFLRVSQTQPRGGPRSQIAIPAQGMEEFKSTLSGLLDVYGTDDHGSYLLFVLLVIIYCDLFLLVIKTALYVDRFQRSRRYCVMHTSLNGFRDHSIIESVLKFEI